MILKELGMSIQCPVMTMPISKTVNKVKPLPQWHLFSHSAFLIYSPFGLEHCFLDLCTKHNLLFAILLWKELGVERGG